MGNICICKHHDENSDLVLKKSISNKLVLNEKEVSQTTLIIIQNEENCDDSYYKINSSCYLEKQLRNDYLQSFVDYDLHATNIFHFINEVRMNPNLEKIENIIAGLKEEEGKLIFKSPILNKGYVFINKNSLNEIKNHTEIVKIEIAKAFNEPIIFSEKAFEILSTRGCKEEKENIFSSLNYTVNFEHKGHYDPELTVYLILLELSTSDAVSLFTQNFKFAGIYCEKEKTTLLFGNKKSNNN